MLIVLILFRLVEFAMYLDIMYVEICSKISKPGEIKATCILERRKHTGTIFCFGTEESIRQLDTWRMEYWRSRRKALLLRTFVVVLSRASSDGGRHRGRGRHGRCGGQRKAKAIVHVSCMARTIHPSPPTKGGNGAAEAQPCLVALRWFLPILCCVVWVDRLASSPFAVLPRPPPPSTVPVAFLRARASIAWHSIDPWMDGVKQCKCGPCKPPLSHCIY